MEMSIKLLNRLRPDMAGHMMKRYYYASTTRVAMRTGTANPKWLLSLCLTNHI